MSVSFAARAQSLHAMEAPAGLCRAAQMGLWGDGCCQHTDQAVGRRSHCYSPRRHVQGMSDTYRGDAPGLDRGRARRFWRLLCIIGHIEQRMWTQEFGSLLGSGVKLGV